MIKKIFVWLLLGVILNSSSISLALAAPVSPQSADSGWKKRVVAKAEALMNSSKKPVEKAPVKVTASKPKPATNSKAVVKAPEQSKTHAAKADLKKSIKLKKEQKQDTSKKASPSALNNIQRQRWQTYSKNGIKNVTGAAIVSEAAKYKGVKYVFGGTTPNGFDCSGYVQYVFKRFNAKLTRTADTQVKEGVFVTQRQLKPGDLVFFSTYEAGASHVGIYAGNGKFWSATSSRGVWLCGLQEDYWRTRYYGARRVLVANGEPG